MNKLSFIMINATSHLIGIDGQALAMIKNQQVGDETGVNIFMKYPKDMLNADQRQEIAKYLDDRKLKLINIYYGSDAHFEINQWAGSLVHDCVSEAVLAHHDGYLNDQGDREIFLLLGYSQYAYESGRWDEVIEHGAEGGLYRYAIKGTTTAEEAEKLMQKMMDDQAGYEDGPIKLHKHVYEVLELDEAYIIDGTIADNAGNNTHARLVSRKSSEIAGIPPERIYYRDEDRYYAYEDLDTYNKLRALTSNYLYVRVDEV